MLLKIIFQGIKCRRIAGARTDAVLIDVLKSRFCEIARSSFLCLKGLLSLLSIQICVYNIGETQMSPQSWTRP